MIEKTKPDVVIVTMVDGNHHQYIIIRAMELGCDVITEKPMTVEDLLMNGAIGEVLSVDFHWLFNTHHGAGYFRRWHSNKAMSAD